LLLLNSVIERGVSAKDDDKSFNLLKSVAQETLQELKTLAEDCLKKRG